MNHLPADGWIIIAFYDNINRYNATGKKARRFFHQITINILTILLTVSQGVQVLIRLSAFIKRPEITRISIKSGNKTPNAYNEFVCSIIFL